MTFKLRKENIDAIQLMTIQSERSGIPDCISCRWKMRIKTLKFGDWFSLGKYRFEIGKYWWF